jgi:hypothetical protein
MLAGSASTSMAGAFIKPAIRPQTMMHKAPQHKVSGVRDPSAEAKAAFQPSGLDIALDVGVDIAKAYFKFKRIDEEAQAETMYLEYQERMSEWTVDKHQTVQTYNQQTGKFEWETIDDDYDNFSEKTWGSLQSKYNIKSRDLVHDYEMKRRANDLTQRNKLGVLQNAHRSARIKANFGLRKDKALKYGSQADYKLTADWGLSNGMYASIDEYNADIAESGRVFNTRDQLRLTDTMGTASTRAMLEEIEKDKLGMMRKYGENGLSQIYKATLDRSYEIHVGKMSEDVSTFQSRESLNAYYNNMKVKSPSELGLATEEQKIELLGKLSAVKTRYETGIAKATSISKTQASKDFHRDVARARVDITRKPMPIVVEQTAPSVESDGIPFRNKPENASVYSVNSDELGVTLDDLTSPVEFARPAVETSEDMIKGYDMAYEQEVGTAYDAGGTIKYRIDVRNPDTHAVAIDYLKASGHMPKSYVDNMSIAITNGSPEESAQAALNLAQVVNADKTGRVLANFPDGGVKEALIVASSVQSNPASFPQMFEEMKQRTQNTVQAQAFAQTWDKNYDAKNPVNDSLRTHAEGKLKDLGIPLDEVPPAYWDDLQAEGREQFVFGLGKGNYNTTAAYATARTNSRWGMDIGPTGERQMIEHSIYAYHGDVTGTDPIVKDKIVSAVVLNSNIPYEEAEKLPLRTVFSGNEQNPQWHIYAKNADGVEQVLYDSTRNPIVITPQQEGIKIEPLAHQQAVEEGKAAAKERVSATMREIDANKPMNKRIDTALKYIVPKAEDFFDFVMENQMILPVFSKLTGLNAGHLIQAIKMIPQMASEVAQHELTDDELNNIANLAASGDIGMTSYENLSEHERKWLGGTAHSMFKSDVSDTLRQMPDISEAQFNQMYNERVASHRMYLEGLGLVIPE